MNSWLTFTTLGALTAAFIQEEELPKKPSVSVTLPGTNSEHTTSSDGSFVHPFDQVDPDVSTIYYESGRTISKRMHRVRTPAKDHLGTNGRAFASNNLKVESSERGYLQSLVDYIWPSYETTF